jgi:hypothetical protein
MEQPLIVVNYENIFLLHKSIFLPMFARVSSLAREQERSSKAGESGAPFHASPGQFASTHQAVQRALRSFCPVPQAVFGDSGSSPGRTEVFPDSFLVCSDSIFCSRSSSSRCKVSTVSDSSPGWNEAGKWPSLDQANPAPDGQLLWPMMCELLRWQARSRQLRARISVLEPQVVVTIEAMPCSKLRICLLAPLPSPF